MNQANLDRAVARATGESVRLVRSMGFTFVPAPRVVLPSPRRHARPRRRVPATASR